MPFQASKQQHLASAATGFWLWDSEEHRSKGLCNLPQGLGKATEVSCVADPLRNLCMEALRSCQSEAWIELETSRCCRPGMSAGECCRQGREPPKKCVARVEPSEPYAMGLEFATSSLCLPPFWIGNLYSVHYVLEVCNLFFDFTVSYNEEIALSFRRHFGL